MSLPTDIIQLISEHLLPEEVLMVRQVSHHWRESVPTSTVMVNDGVRVGSFVCYKDRYRRKNFPVWGSDVGTVVAIENKKVVVQTPRGLIRRAHSGVRRIRIFPGPIAVRTLDGFLHNCPGCYGMHFFSKYTCLRTGDCLISINKARVNPFPKGFIQVNDTHVWLRQYSDVVH